MLPERSPQRVPHQSDHQPLLRLQPQAHFLTAGLRQAVLIVLSTTVLLLPPPPPPRVHRHLSITTSREKSKAKNRSRWRRKENYESRGTSNIRFRLPTLFKAFLFVMEFQLMTLRKSTSSSTRPLSSRDVTST